MDPSRISSLNDFPPKAGWYCVLSLQNISEVYPRWGISIVDKFANSKCYFPEPHDIRRFYFLSLVQSTYVDSRRFFWPNTQSQRSHKLFPGECMASTQRYREEAHFLSYRQICQYPRGNLNTPRYIGYCLPKVDPKKYKPRRSGGLYFQNISPTTVVS